MNDMNEMKMKKQKGCDCLGNYVITIARGYGSGGRTIGKMLAKELGISYYDRELMRLASDESGINESLFAKADEKLKSSLLFKVAKNIYKGEIIGPDSDEFVSNDNLFNYQAKVLKELAEKESYVVIGRCADFILKDFDNVIRVFVHAPMDNCIDKIATMSAMTRKEAEQLIIRTDKHRADYYHHYTGHTWNNATNYDLCLNTEELSFKKCVEIVKEYKKIKFE